MKLSLAWFLRGAIFVVVVIGVYLVMLWRPTRQVELHTEHLLARVSSRNWDGVKGMMAEDYGDRWGHNRGSALADAMQVFGQFFSLQITPTEKLKMEKVDGGYVVKGPMEILGTGTAIAQVAMDTMRNAGGEFEFRWRKSGSMPWKWELVEINNEKLPASIEESF